MSDAVFIFAAGMISLFFRLFPILFFSEKAKTEHRALFSFFDYAMYAIIGSLIYLSAFGEISFLTLLQESDGLTLLKIISLVLAAVLSLLLKDVILPLVLALVFYLFANSFGGY